VLRPPDTPSGLVLRLMLGHWAMQATRALALMGIPDLLADGARSAESLADAVGADREALARLLRAAASIGLLAETSPGEYELTDAGHVLRSGTPLSLRETVLAWGSAGGWKLAGELVQAVRAGRSVAPEVLGHTLWEYHASNPELGTHFARAMGENTAHVAPDVAEAVNTPAYRRIVDVGGAHGELLLALLERAPDAQGVLFDLPRVVENARARLERSPLAGRVELVGGDFLEQVPHGDLYLLKWILHDWDDDRARQILAACRRAAAPGARLVIVEFLVPEPWAPSPVHLMDLSMLALTGGRERTRSEYEALLEAAGWSVERVTGTSGLFSVLQAAAGDPAAS